MLILLLIFQSLAMGNVLAIVGGTIALEGAFPYASSVQRRVHGAIVPVCTATIFSERYQVSACQCFATWVRRQQQLKPHNISEFRISAGSSHRYPVTQTYQLRYIRRIHFHPDCSGDTRPLWINDYAVIELQDPFVLIGGLKEVQIYATSADPLKFFSDKMIRTRERCKSYGWGATTGYIDENTGVWEYGNHSSRLIVAYVELMPFAECKRYICRHYDRTCTTDFEKTRLGCARSIDGRSGVCKGDIGGPVVCGDFIWGFFNSYLSCGKKPIPEVIALLDNGIEFIMSIVPRKSSSIKILPNLFVISLCIFK